MSSGVAMGKHAGGLAEYRSSEGKAVTLPYRGMIKATINDILGGIRSSCTYVGARYSTTIFFKLFRVFSPVDIEYTSRVPLTQSSPHHLLTSSFLFFNINFFVFSKLKELSKRTTFIRVSQQINEVFGSTNEERADTTVPTGSASVSLTNGTGNSSSSNVESSGMKRSREE